jgi:hypothetical protein
MNVCVLYECVYECVCVLYADPYVKVELVHEGETSKEEEDQDST